MSPSIPIELLCPAKDAEVGIAAISHGADAVYIGYQHFGAREAAGNTLQDIQKLINYAHLFHAKVYITLNTIIYNDELAQVQDLIHKLYQMGADALIIQDMGILEMDLPPIPLHASTQTHNKAVNKIQFLQDVGFQRVILARELSIEEIKVIRKSTQVELETFVHGALCVSYSGQCYMSHALTGRSANRGECAQPCRMKYNLVDGDGIMIISEKHLLSLKDLNLSSSIAELLDAGITSLKIEGRLKDIGYVKNITAHYRKILDDIFEKDSRFHRASSGQCKLDFIPDPEKTFNRGYTQYFSKGRSEAMASFNTPKSIGKPLGLVDGIGEKFFILKSGERVSNNDGLCFINRQGTLTGIKVNQVDGDKIYPSEPFELSEGTLIYRNYDHNFVQSQKKGDTSLRKISADLQVLISSETITLTLADENSIITNIEFSHNYDPASKPEAMLGILAKQLTKMGNTPFIINRINIETSSVTIPFIPIGEVNEFRRQIVETHIKERVASHPFQRIPFSPNNILHPESSATYKANISNRLAKQFYKRHGVTQSDDAFELLHDYSGKVVMTTRYCMLFEIGLCKKLVQDKPKEYYLLDNNNRYALQFNCDRCEMNIVLPNNSEAKQDME